MNIPALQSSFSGINNLLYKSYLPKIINTALDIGLFETLNERPKRLGEISTALNTVENIMESLLDVLIFLELVTQKGNCYSLTLLAREYLTTGSDANQICAVRSFSGSASPFDHLAQCLKDGPAKFDHKMWATEEAARNMEQGAKAGMLQDVLSFVTEIPQFQKCRNMCDFAGNTGYYSFALMTQNSDLKCHVYDLPEVCLLAEKMKHNEMNFNRIGFHGMDTTLGDSFGNGYDMFFVSHFLYEYGATGRLEDFLKKVNRAMLPGGIFISNHIGGHVSGEHALTLSIVELITRSMGYQTHRLEENLLTEALTNAGFGDFKTRHPDESTAYPTHLFSAVKVSEV